MTRHQSALAPLVVLFVMFLAVGCGQQSGKSETAATPAGTAGAAPAGTPSGAAAQPAAASQEADSLPPDEGEAERAVISKKWTGDLDGMIERRMIRVLTTYSKTMYFVDRGTQLGLVAEAFRLFEDDLNKKLKTGNVRVHVVFVPVAHDDLIPALLDGRGDLVAAHKVITAWRKEQVDFTNPTARGISSIVVSAPGTQPLSNPQELAGKEIYLRESDISMPNVERFNAELKAAGKPPVKVRPAPEVLADEDILEMVNAGLAQTTIADDDIAEFWKQIFPDLVLSRGAAVRTDTETAMMVRKNSPKLLAELNAFIAKYPEGSLQRNVLTQKYLKNIKYAKGATSGPEVQRFRQTVELLRKYSGEYKLDYLLMAAQGYQESGLDQSKKSSVGAIGVMQVMPATGADMKVGDINKIDANIHAGVKYIRFMMDQYYADEPMDQLNKGLFTFASYNAGPGRVRGLRARAEKRGLNPNVWFNNVELVAAQAIGRETVQYVSNIYKYYLAYKLLSEQRDEREKAKRGTS